VNDNTSKFIDEEANEGRGTMDREMSSPPGPADLPQRVPGASLVGTDKADEVTIERSVLKKLIMEADQAEMLRLEIRRILREAEDRVASYMRNSFSEATIAGVLEALRGRKTDRLNWEDPKYPCLICPDAPSFSSEWALGRHTQLEHWKLHPATAHFLVDEDGGVTQHVGRKYHPDLDDELDGIPDVHGRHTIGGVVPSHQENER
jgi:hypothetical protein